MFSEPRGMLGTSINLHKLQPPASLSLHFLSLMEASLSALISTISTCIHIPEPPFLRTNIVKDKELRHPVMCIQINIMSFIDHLLTYNTHSILYLILNCKYNDNDNIKKHHIKRKYTSENHYWKIKYFFPSPDVAKLIRQLINNCKEFIIEYWNYKPCVHW